jgi:hypothetical protein
MSWEIDQFKDNKLFYKKMHIMCELAIPLSIHLGIKNIYTVGWDLGKIDKKFYYDTTRIDKDYPVERTELPYIPHIVKLLNKKNINIYKIKEISPILLPYYNLFQ